MAHPISFTMKFGNVKNGLRIHLVALKLKFLKKTDIKCVVF